MDPVQAACTALPIWQWVTNAGIYCLYLFPPYRLLCAPWHAPSRIRQVQDVPPELVPELIAGGINALARQVNRSLVSPAFPAEKWLALASQIPGVIWFPVIAGASIWKISLASYEDVPSVMLWQKQSEPGSFVLRWRARGAEAMEAWCYAVNDPLSYLAAHILS